MDLKMIIFLAADAVMVVAAAVYGWKFLRKGNYLLGLEWWVVMVSGSNFFVYALTGSPTLYNISFFFDAFSRAFGFPVIAILGLMAVTHRYRPSTLVDVAIFVLSAVGAAILIGVAAVAPVRPYLYLLMWTAYSVFLCYFAWRLVRVGERVQAFGLMLVTVTAQAIATIYDFYHIPGDDDQHTLFYIAALSVWAYSLLQTYYAYCALERAEAR